LSSQHKKTTGVSDSQFYQLNTPYSITLNPIDKHQYYCKEHRRGKVKSFIHEWLLSVKANFSLIMEYSEPRNFHIAKYNGSRLHCHGIITFPTTKSLAQWLDYDMYQILRWSSIDIDTCPDRDKWSAYCRKQKIIKDNLISNILPPLI